MKNSKQLLFERMSSIGRMPLKENVINEMPKKITYDFQGTSKWEDMLNDLKNNYDIDGVSIVKKGAHLMFRLEKKGYKPIDVLAIKPEYGNSRYIDWIVKNILNETPNRIEYFTEKPKQKRITKLSPNASIQDKIKMWDLISEKAYDVLHNTKKHDEVFWTKMWNKYGYPWGELYEEIEDTPEFEQFRLKNNMATNLTFDDMLA